MNQQSANSRQIIPRSLPRGVGRTPQKLEVPYESTASNLTLKERLQAIQKLDTENFHPFCDSFNSLKDLVLEDDENAAPEPVKSYGKVSKKLSFCDQMQDELNGLEGVNVPDYIKLINESIQVSEERKKLTRDAVNAQLSLEFKTAIKVDTLMKNLADSFVPAMDKLNKDPVRILEVIRKIPPKYGVRCKLEDQPTLIEHLSQLGQDCRELKQVDAESVDFQAELKSLEESMSLVDSMLNTKAMEKMKFKQLKARLDEISKPENIDDT